MEAVLYHRKTKEKRKPFKLRNRKLESNGKNKGGGKKGMRRKCSWQAGKESSELGTLGTW
jgi:hypothetical protein